MEFSSSQSSSTTLVPEDDVSETETVALEPEDSPQSQEVYLRQSCGPLRLRPLTRFSFPKITETTGFNMIHVLLAEDIHDFEPTSNSAVAVIQGLDVGVFESWALASQHVSIIGAVFSFHSTMRDARICYLRALIGGMVCFIHDEGLSESVVSPCMPGGWDTKTWWKLGWQLWDAGEGIKLPVPTIRP